MRTKDEILNDARSDIRNKTCDYPMSYWLRYRQLEVLIDIRDILDRGIFHTLELIQDIKDKP